MNIDGIMTMTHAGARDERGSFTKVYQGDLAPFDTITFAESYYSTSRRGVLRGLHFQVPPVAHTKLVTCISGRVFDCVLDLRTASPTFGESFHCELAPGEAILVPEGCAHGFCVISDEATLLYHVTTVHAPEHDAGVHWTSAAVPWPVTDPLLSPRDRALPLLRDFPSPF